MNLVQQQEALRTLPIPALQAKAQGQDPETPPWLAASVLNERMAAQQKAGIAQGAAQGPQSSIAEQLQQKAGLMAVQAQQQQQAQQQMMQQMAQAPQAVPQDIPQPQAQPQAPTMMAGGGIARLPVDPRMFNYREGGVIGFAGEDDGSFVYGYQEPSEEQKAELRRKAEEFKNKKYVPTAADKLIAKQAAGIPLSAQEKAIISAERQSANQPTGSVFVPGSSSGLRPERETAGLGSLAQDVAPSTGPAVAPNRVRTGPAVALPKPLAPQPAPQPAPAAPPPPAESSDLQRLMLDALKSKNEPRSAADAQAEYEAATPAELKQPAGLEMLNRLKQQQQQYEASKQSQPMDNWMRGLAAAARGGIGGFGTADIENRERTRAADAAQADYQNKVMTAVEAMRRGEATAQQKAVLDAVGKSRTSTAEAERNRLTQLTSARGNEMSAETSRLTNLSNERIHALDRQLREKLHNTPQAQRASIEEKAIQDYMVQHKLPYSEAFERVKQISSGFKGELTLDQATDNVQKFLESGPGLTYVREVQKKAKDAGQPVPNVYSIKNDLIQKEMSGSSRSKPASSSLLSAADKIVSGGK